MAFEEQDNISRAAKDYAKTPEGKRQQQRDESPTTQQYFQDTVVAKDPFAWTDTVASTILAELAAWSDVNGVSRAEIKGQWEARSSQMYNAIWDQLFTAGDTKQKKSTGIVRQIMEGNIKPEEAGVSGMGSSWYTSTLEGQSEMLQFARDWWGKTAGIQLKSGGGGGGGGGGRGGPKAPTAEEIRNQFDIKQLANDANEMSRGLVLADHKDALGLARKYVEAVVATKGEKKIDFQTFVRGDIENTSRFKSIYTNKPPQVSAEEYISPYLQAAMSFVRPGDADDIAIGGAQFGASPESFRQRLNRDDAVTGSAPFINGIEGRMQELKSLFKG